MGVGVLGVGGADGAGGTGAEEGWRSWGWGVGVALVPSWGEESQSEEVGVGLWDGGPVCQNSVTAVIDDGGWFPVKVGDEAAGATERVIGLASAGGRCVACVANSEHIITSAAGSPIAFTPMGWVETWITAFVSLGGNALFRSCY